MSAAQAQTKPTEQAHAQQAPLKAPDTMAERVRGCTAAMASTASTDNDYFPRLAGKPAEYLYNQLVNFRDGRRKYPPMNYLLTYLNDDYLREMAEHFGRTPAVPGAGEADAAGRDARARQAARHARRPVPQAAGLRLPRRDADRHAAGDPGRLGLHADYLSAQIGAWRSGNRHAKAPDCMHEVASKLSDEDVTAVTALARATGARQPVPAPARSMKTPLACGSEPQ